jgi:hypothetical protein
MLLQQCHDQYFTATVPEHRAMLLETFSSLINKCTNDLILAHFNMQLRSTLPASNELFGWYVKAMAVKCHPETVALVDCILGLLETDDGTSGYEIMRIVLTPLADGILAKPSRCNVKVS